MLLNFRLFDPRRVEPEKSQGKGGIINREINYPIARGGEAWRSQHQFAYRPKQSWEEEIRILPLERQHSEQSPQNSCL